MARCWWVEHRPKFWLISAHERRIWAMISTFDGGVINREISVMPFEFVGFQWYKIIRMFLAAAKNKIAIEIARRATLKSIIAISATDRKAGHRNTLMGPRPGHQTRPRLRDGKRQLACAVSACARNLVAIIDPHPHYFFTPSVLCVPRQTQR